jgi:hypothetical protein
VSKEREHSNDVAEGQEDDDELEIGTFAEVDGDDG